MPFAQVHLVEGHSAEQKRAVITKVTQALQDAVGAPRPNVRVWIHELPKCDFGIGGESVEALEDTALPFAQLFLIEGRSEEQKRAVIENVTLAQRAVAEFVSTRIREDIEAQQKLLRCKSFDEVRSVQSKFIETAVAQYRDNAARLFKLGQDIVAKSTPRAH